MASVIETVFGDHIQHVTVLGAIALLYLSLKLCLSLWSGLKAFVLSRLLGLSVDLKKLGSWAVVTGATDGIGKAYALELARKGINIILISRSPQKLADVAQEIKKKYSNIQTKEVAVDFTGGQEIYDQIKTELQGMDIGTLVNNVGMSFGYPQYFGEQENKGVHEDIVRVNVMSVVKMTEVLLPSFLEKKKGAIINISSSSGLISPPLLSTYGASKAFVGGFSEALLHELRSKGIIVQVVVPFFVATKMSRLRPSLFVPDPVSYARAALGTVGIQDQTFGCLSHAFQGWVVSMVPRGLVISVVTYMMKGARSSALRKIKRQQSTKKD